MKGMLEDSEHGCFRRSALGGKAWQLGLNVREFPNGCGWDSRAPYNFLLVKSRVWANFDA